MKNQNVINEELVEVKEQVEEIETPAPKFKLVKITRSIGRTINTGDYQNQKIDISLEAEIYNTEDYKEVADQLKEMIETELDIQEQEILEKVKKAKEEKLQQEEQVKTEEAQVQYTQYIFNVKGQNLVVSNDPNFEMKCPKCGRPLALRNGQWGEFYGCTGYNQGCRFSVNKSEIESFLQAQINYQPTFIAKQQSISNMFVIPELDDADLPQDLPQAIPMVSPQIDDDDIPF